MTMQERGRGVVLLIFTHQLSMLGNTEALFIKELSVHAKKDSSTVSLSLSKSPSNLAKPRPAVALFLRSIPSSFFRNVVQEWEKACG